MNNLKIFAKTIEQQAKDQIDLLLKQDAFSDCKVRIMPDVHAGSGCVIGFTADLGDKVIPNIVGVDIGCGMYCVNLGRIEIDYNRFDDIIRSNIPNGMNVNDIPVEYFDIQSLQCFHQLKNIDWLKNSLCSLGGGNHFIEIDENKNGEKLLVIHTGSRNFGKQVADIYQKIAVKNVYSRKDGVEELVKMLKFYGREKDIQSELAKFKKNKPSIPKDLCYVEGSDRDNYLHDMKICQEFAKRNRELIARKILLMYGIDSFGAFHTTHNYIDDTNMVRKGAISARYGEKLIIPINMRDGCIVGVGKGNKDWDESGPHGAGRIMGRKQAKKSISLEEYSNSMSDVFSTSICEDTIDEAPQAYKSMDEIVEMIKDTVSILDIVRPVYNFKAKE